METSVKRSSDRLIFLDNLRYLFVLCVVIFHSGNMYSVFTQWWPVAGKEPDIFISIFNSFINVFSMPLLFFIAGYFALPSIRKQNALSFIKEKLKRLSIPWIVCILTICPILPLIYHYTRNGFTLSMTYLDTWMILLKNAARFDFGLFSMNEIMKNDGFYQRYMWFLSLLFFFFLIFSIIYKIKKSWFDKMVPVVKEKSPVKSGIIIVTATGILTFLCSAISLFPVLITGENGDIQAWVTLGNIVQFSPMQLSGNIIYFVLGIIVFRNNWIERGKFPTNIKFWIFPFCIFSTIFIYAAVNSFVRNKEASDAIYILYLLSNWFLCISVLGLFSSIALKYWNSPGKSDRNLASNSYNIYLSHYIFVLVFQLILLSVPGIPALLKFAVISTASITCSYYASRYLIKPHPKITVLLLFSISIIMFVVIRP